MDTTDEELWSLAQGGSAVAFEALFERHADTVYNYCFRRTGNWSLAEDLVSAVFTEAWRQRDRVIPHDGSLRPWLLGVATNKLKSHARTEARRRRAFQRLTRTWHVADPAPEIADRMADEELMSAVLRGIRELKNEEQDVLALCVWMEESYESAATSLQIPVGTVRSRLSRARAKLKKAVFDGTGNADVRRTNPSRSREAAK